jgi:tripartite-type tricarboxylate transporter receptor subunit TctC
MPVNESHAPRIAGPGEAGGRSRRRALAIAAARDRRRVLAALAACGLAAGAGWSSPVRADGDWPKGQVIRLVVPFTAGSGTDIVARLVAGKLGQALGTSVIADNKPGAGGTVGAAMVAKAAPDGLTMLVHSAGHLVNPSIYPNLSYDTLKDFAGVTPLASLPNVLVAEPGRFRDVGDLVAKAKAKPGGFNYASAGNGSATHMNAEVFRLAAGLDAQHVPFRGTPEAMTETMAGRIDWFFAPLVSSLPLIREGRLQALAVGTGKRAPALPQVPTTVEAGVPGSEYQFWVGLFAPARTPRPVVERMHDEVVKAMAMADVKERLDKLGADAFLMAPAEFDKFISAETARSQEIVRKAGIKVD